MRHTRKNTAIWPAAFLTGLRAGHSATRAAEAAGIDRSTAYARRKSTPDFARAWAEAEDAARENAAAGTGTTPRKKRRRGGPWKPEFLRMLAETSNVTAAALAAGVKPLKAYLARREDPDFAHSWRQALYEGYEHLEMEVLAFLRGNLPERRVDVANAIRQLAAHRKTVAVMRAVEGEENPMDVRDSIDAMIDEMKAEWAAKKAENNRDG